MRKQPVSPARYRRRRLAAALIGVLLIVGLGMGTRVLLYDAGLADVENVQVTGATTVSADEVLAAAAVATGAPLAAVDTGAVATRVAQLPALESVRVSRGWPHTVTVDVTERVALAAVATPAGAAVVDRFGVVYPGVPAPGLPRLTFGAVGPDDTATEAAIAVLMALPEPVRSQLLTVDATATAPGVPGQVTLGLTGNRQVRWGAPDRQAEKAAVLVPLLTQNGRTFDVTSPDLPTIRR